MEENIKSYDKNHIIFYDTETTGLPEWKKPSGGEDQPHIVQLGALLVEAKTREVVSTLDVIIKPVDWTISQEMTDIHGITDEYAREVGVDESQAVAMFIDMRKDFLRVAHNRTFDKRVIRIATKRYFSDEVQERWHDKEGHDCTMFRKGYKSYVKLSDRSEEILGYPLEDGHKAIIDATRCMEIYWGMIDAEAIARAPSV